MKNNKEHDTMSGSTVYIIDDDEAVCDSLGILLSSIGLKNKGYLSANEFLEAYTEPEFEKDIGCIVLRTSSFRAYFTNSRLLSLTH